MLHVLAKISTTGCHCPCFINSVQRSQITGRVRDNFSELAAIKKCSHATESWNRDPLPDIIAIRVLLLPWNASMMDSSSPFVDGQPFVAMSFASNTL
jgi:hypothetical protein